MKFCLATHTQLWDRNFKTILYVILSRGFAAWFWLCIIKFSTSIAFQCRRGFLSFTFLFQINYYVTREWLEVHRHFRCVKQGTKVFYVTRVFWNKNFFHHIECPLSDSLYRLCVTRTFSLFIVLMDAKLVFDGTLCGVTQFRQWSADGS